MSYKLAVIGGDGIGPEVSREAIRVLESVGLDFTTTNFDLGAQRYVRDGVVLDDSDLHNLKAFDAIILGAIGPAIGSTEVPPGILERGLLLKLRFELDLFINMRPFTAPMNSIAAGSDFVVIRENTEGTYAGEGGFLRKNSPNEVATQGSVNTRFGVERCVRFAFELATRRSNHLTLVHKTNVLTFAGDLWQRTFDDVKSEYPSVRTDYNHVDAACIYMVTQPQNYDVIVTDNLFGDILTDLAGAVTGGIGLAASANLNAAKTGPSVFEPVHGAAHDIAGQNKANPLAAIRSAAMLLDHLGEVKMSERVLNSVIEVSELLAADAGRVLTTADITDLVIERIN